MNVTIIDYGMGNLWSVLSALRYLGATAELSDNPEQIAASPVMILPGVGSFRKAMEALRGRKIEPAIHEGVSRGAKMLGICLGMQLLGSAGSEDGETKGLGLVPNRVDPFTPEELDGNKTPHIGFNQVRKTGQSVLLKNLPDGADFYFVHSYRMLPAQFPGDVGRCTYGVDFVATFQVGNVFGAQFHPEKSQTNGLLLLKNFLDA